jgi:hypothetical protein
VVVDKKTRKVICTDFSNGKRHDFRLYKESRTHIHKDIQADTDTGYQGIKKLHENSILPNKNTKKKPLTLEEKAQNRKISSARVTNEHAIQFRLALLTPQLRIYQVCSHQTIDNP